MRVTVIVNPIAGKRSSHRPGKSRVAVQLLEALGHDVDIHETARALHARELAETAVAQGAALVFAWGGDGTVNEVGSALVFSDTPLAIIPSGSGNGLANALGIDHSVERAIAGALSGTDRRIDAGELDGRLFFNVAGVGLDALVARRFAAAGSRRGLATYVALSLRALLDHDPLECTVTLDGSTVTSRLDLLVLANASEYGNGIRVAPDARLDDGALDVVVAESRSLATNVWRAGRLLQGKVGFAPGVLTRRVEHVRITASDPIWYHVDGEPIEGGRELLARVHPLALKIRVPSG